MIAMAIFMAAMGRCGCRCLDCAAIVASYGLLDSQGCWLFAFSYSNLLLRRRAQGSIQSKAGCCGLQIVSGLVIPARVFFKLG